MNSTISDIASSCERDGEIIKDKINKIRIELNKKTTDFEDRILKVGQDILETRVRLSKKLENVLELVEDLRVKTRQAVHKWD